MQLGVNVIQALQLIDGPQSVLALLDQCKTAGGSRLLKQWLLEPCAKLHEIDGRQRVVEALQLEDQITAG